MSKFRITYALYWDVEVEAWDEKDAEEQARNMIPSMNVGSDDWLMCDCEEIENA